MISCTEFIPAYSELFKFLHERGGKEEVMRFWEYLSDTFLGNLRSLAEQKGLRGCWEYWSHSLNEEAADFTMELDEDAGAFRIAMHHCPSMGRLLEEEHIEPYAHYCEHCDTLYRRVLEPLGFEYDIDLSNCHEARCSITVSRGRQTVAGHPAQPQSDNASPRPVSRTDPQASGQVHGTGFRCTASGRKNDYDCE